MKEATIITVILVTTVLTIWVTKIQTHRHKMEVIKILVENGCLENNGSYKCGSVSVNYY